IGRGSRWALCTSWKSSGGSLFRREQLQKVIGADGRPLRENCTLGKELHMWTS
ncbi:hypothetical protein NDU88_001621, partial [Pleurodeles waltl]